MSTTDKMNKRDFLKKAGLATAGAAAATTLAAPYVKAQAPITWRLQTYAGPALAEHVIGNSIECFNKAANGEMVIELYTADQLVPHGELFRAVQAGTIDAAQSDDDSRRRAGRRARVRRLLPVRLALLARRAGAVALVRAEGDLGGGLRRDPRGHLAFDRLLGPVQLRHDQADPLGRRPPGPARLHLPDRRAVPGAVRRRAGVAALRGRAAGDPDRRARRRLLVRHHRDAHGRLGRRRQILPDQSALGRMGRLLLRQHREMERGAGAPEAAVPARDRQLALLPPALVLGGRGALPQRGQAGADLDPRRGMEDDRGRGRRVLGRDRHRRARATPRSSRS